MCEAIADESVQADALLCGSENQFAVQGFGNPLVELAGESSFRDWARTRFTSRLQIGDDLSYQIDQAPKSFGLVLVEP